MTDELARIRPRGRQDVQVRLDRNARGSTIIVRAPGGDAMPLTAVGYFAFLQMDGETSLQTIEAAIARRFEGAGVEVEHLCRLVERLQGHGLLFEDRRAVLARDALAKVGLQARRERAPAARDGVHNRHNEEVAALVHAGWAALVGSEYPRAVSKFRQASESLPRSLRLARLVDVLERVGAGDQQVDADPWIGIDRLIKQALNERCCPACGGDLQLQRTNAYSCTSCAGAFEH